MWSSVKLTDNYKNVWLLGTLTNIYFFMNFLMHSLESLEKKLTGKGLRVLAHSNARALLIEFPNHKLYFVASLKKTLARNSRLQLPWV